MRIVVSGTHASGKSTLISDFALRHPEFVVLPDPFELIDEAWDGPRAAVFGAQLRIAADRLSPRGAAPNLIAERGPLDFLAYLLALDDRGGAITSDALERARAIAADALEDVDLLVVLPLTASAPIEVGADEHLELRQDMNDALLDLLDDPDLIGAGTTVVEITGDATARLAALDAAVDAAVASRTPGDG